MKWMTSMMTYGFVSTALFLLQSMFFAEISLIPSLLICFIWVLSQTMWGKKGGLVVIVFFGVLLLAVFPSFMNDMRITINAVAAVLADRKGIYLDLLHIKDMSSILNGLFLSSVALCLTIIAFSAIRDKKSMPILTVMIIVWTLQMLLNVAPDVWLDVLFFGIVLLVLMANHAVQVKWWKTVSIVPFLVIVGMLAVAFVIDEGEEKAAFSDKLEKEVVSKAHTIRYQKGVNLPLPDGDLTKLASFKPKDKIALNVVMENPMPMYLRGFVGSAYSDNEWKALEGDIYLENQSLFNGLQEQKFMSFEQLSLAVQIGLSEQFTQSNMTVQNVAANSRYLYAPYELAHIDHEEVRTIDGTMLEADSFFGTRTYQLSYMNTSVNEYPKIANAMYKNQDNSYFNHESYYNQYVYQQFLYIPSEIQSLLQNHILSENKELTSDRVSYEQAIQFVSDYVEQTIAYKEEIEQTKTENFMTTLLEETREGYSVHYATASTLLFRALGFPARYVEGYIVTPKDVENSQAYSEIEISEKNAHAWTEIYIDMVGWILVEVTPPYKERMPKVNMEDYPSVASMGGANASANDITSSIGEVNNKRVQEDDDVPKTPNTSNEFIYSWHWVVLFIVVVLISVILFYVYRRIKLQKKIRVTDHRLATIRLFTYMLRMLELEGVFVQQQMTMLPGVIEKRFTKELAFEMEKGIRIYQRAMYSPKPITVEEQQDIQSLFQHLRKTIKSSKKHMKKLMFLWRYY